MARTEKDYERQQKDFKKKPSIRKWSLTIVKSHGNRRSD